MTNYCEERRIVLLQMQEGAKRVLNRISYAFCIPKF